MSEEGSGNSKFVVRDRRRFDSEGNDRADGSSERSSSAASTPSPTSAGASSASVASSREAPASEPSVSKQEQATKGRPDLGPPPDTEINFSSFVISLATQALMQLGEIQPPDGMPIAVDRDGARQTIDILSVIDYKTRGNLTEEEAKLMEEVLHRLRLSYVKHMKSA
jgi:hypothetical protein